MIFSGVDIMNPLSADLVKWGANFKPLTMEGEWWRLLSCVFIHIGVIHLLFNMYALYTIGIYLEPMLGKVRYISAYLATGVFASMASLWWHKESITSAGASGAIFGVYGVFLALLSTNLIPKQVRNSLLQSIGVFVLFNLLYGMKGGIDNSAHIGGLLSGILIGYLFYMGLSKKINIGKITVATIVVLFTAVATWLFITKYSDDTVKFNSLLKSYSLEEDMALTPIRNSTSMTASEFKDELEKRAIPAWDKNLEIVQQMDALNLTDRLEKYVINLKKYTELRKQETEILIKAQDEPEGTFDKEQEEISSKLKEILKEMKGSD
jgi:rhomboid protease GluP